MPTNLLASLFQMLEMVFLAVSAFSWTKKDHLPEQVSDESGGTGLVYLKHSYPSKIDALYNPT